MNTIVNSACALAALGFAVFACKPRSKTPATRHGHKDATRDPDEIKRTFRPRHNIGVATGAMSGVWVLDVDGPEGLKALAELEKRHGKLPRTVCQETGGGGRQFFFTLNGRPIKNRTKIGGKPIDVRGEGGYAVVAPSIHPSGAAYRWLHAPDAEPSAEAPVWLIDFVTAREPSTPRIANGGGPAASHATAADLDVVARATSYVARIPAVARGQRNAQAFRVASALVRDFALSDADAWSILLRWNAACDPPLDDGELQTILASARENGKHPVGAKLGGRRAKGKRKGASRRSTEGLPIIVIDTDEDRVGDEAIDALSRRAGIFQRVGTLVQITREGDPPPGVTRPKGAPRIGIMPRPVLREKMAASAVWVRSGDAEAKPCHVPDWAVRAVECRGEWRGIPQLEAVVEAPVLRADGSVLQAPGFDAQSGVFFEPSANFPPIPAAPTKRQIARAVAALEAVVVDFPFLAKEHRSAWIAATMTPFSRFAFHGPAPLLFIDGNVRGVGKTLLADATGIIVTGREMPRMAAPNDAEETRKAITALALGGERLVLLDNVVRQFGNSAIDAALTAVSWSDRLLGSTRMLTNMPLCISWFATGNNVILEADTARRVLWCRLESPEERPEERAGFRHPNLPSWVKAHRARLAAAALMILRGYHVAGRPSQGLRAWGSFEAWSDLVRSAVVWAGLADPAATRRELGSQAERESLALEQLLDGLEECDPSRHGLTVSEILRRLESEPELHDGLRTAIEELVHTPLGKPPSTKSVGMRLRNLRRRFVGGRCLDGRNTRLGVFWFVDYSESGASGDYDSPLNARTKKVGTKKKRGSGKAKHTR